MENLFFNLHESKQLQRQIKILMYLRKRNQIISITELTKEVGCTPPTLRTDIQHLRTKLPSTIQLLSIKMIGYRLKIPDGETLETSLLKLARETITYKLIDQSLHGRQQSFEAMRQEYHLSSSVLRKIIRHLNQELKNYRIKLSPKNGEFIGAENDIRFFFFHFYLSFRRTISTDDTYSFTKERYQALFTELQQAFHPHLHISYFRATLWLSILKEHWLQQKKGEISEEVLAMIQTRKSFARFAKKITPFFKNLLGIQQLSTSELAWTYLIILHCVSYHSTDTRTANHYQEETTLKKWFKQRLSEESFIAGTTNEGLEQMSAYLANLHQLKKLTDQFEKHSLSITHLADNWFQERLLSWQTRLHQPDWQKALSLTYTNDVALSLSMIQFSAQSMRERKKETIIFTLHGDAGYDSFLMKMIQEWLPKSYRPLFLFDQPVTPLDINESGASLVVSNYDLADSLTCEVIKIAHVPSQEEWADLKKYLIEHSLNHSLSH